MNLLSDPVLGHVAQTTHDVVGGSKKRHAYACRPEEEIDSSFVGDKEGQKIVLICIVAAALVALVVKAAKFL